MAGLYLHVPYCRQACHYCDFHFSTQLGTLPSMGEAMQREIAHRFPEPEAMETWYWGGGTPSVLPAAVLRQWVGQSMRSAPLAPGGEFTLEANPEDLNTENLALWQSVGVNRLSVGIQSFVNQRLQWMNRAHTGLQAKEGIARAQDAGFENISVDLMYGLPETSLGEWQDNVGQALELGTPHLSTYALTVEERTPLHHQIHLGKTPAPKDERATEDFLWLRHTLRAVGWEPYEISNASKPGWRAKHNSAYWSGQAYTGIGPGAHSFDGQQKRGWNIANNARYLKAWKAENGLPDSAIFETETLTAKDRLNEQIMTQLRRMEGLPRHAMGSYAAILDKRWLEFQEKDWMIISDKGWHLTDMGLMWMDQIASKGFAEEKDLGTLDA
ncbi:MAG: radical SAM family heme chaperone HemW [Cryomorphaceae bacterium]|jgi:oxygen-independent coproporphyrinogen III oxidase|nr:radical SAM family heme chaperone HemW [Cryomorphaceae bacterium]